VKANLGAADRILAHLTTSTSSKWKEELSSLLGAGT
jgi:hypothetical protein